ncbi:uncharacterized protein LOC125946332 [Dermacentor silvarum]|uniref:uncharacterized protein LOC125946332 n=1 Tax=Dermacentor silvarum TaxID=543639 RepID=UPI002101459F|nr:uncharacterized protein LOC125946332 [Dermacentor silvarum]
MLAPETAHFDRNDECEVPKSRPIGKCSYVRSVNMGPFIRDLLHRSQLRVSDPPLAKVNHSSRGVNMTLVILTYSSPWFCDCGPFSTQDRNALFTKEKIESGKEVSGEEHP